MCAASSFASAVPEAPTRVESTIESVGLFKNGLAVVRRTVSLPADGATEYDLVDLPQPIHGTFWVESTADLAIRMNETDVAVDDADSLPDMTNDALAGARVVVFFKNEQLQPVEGQVVQPPDAQRRWSRDYGWARPRGRWHWWSPSPSHSGMTNTTSSRSLVLDGEHGRMIIDPDTIAYLRVTEPAESRTQRRPVMRLSMTQRPSARPIDVSVLYLTKGASWAPSYAMDISSESELVLRQKAVIRNEIEDFEDVELLLITGYPAIEFGHVRSPMSHSSDLSTFFAALGHESRLSHASRGDVMAQTVMTNVASPNAGAAPDIADPSLIGVDLHEHSIGRHSLALGETLTLMTAKATTPYERIVRWNVPDDRDEWGRRQSHPWWQPHDQSGDGEPWDAIRFTNPLDRPLTTAPATILSRGMVRGQQLCYWTAPGGQVEVRVNRALSVRADIREEELEQQREDVSMYGRRFYRSTLRGTIELANQRAEPVEMVVRVAFSGELLEADGEPETSLRAEGAWSVNPRRQMMWTITLKPGERRELTYTYRVLAPR